MRRRQFGKIFTSPIAIFGGSIAFGLLSAVLRSFTDLALIKGNQGVTYMYIEIVFHILFGLLFGILIAATIYKRQSMKKISARQSSKGLIGTFLGTLVAGCPACTITLASYIGLASLVAILPWGGLELKFVGLCLMIWSVYDTIRYVDQCKL